MATHFSILAWRIPWIGEPGGLQSMGCKESDTTAATEQAEDYSWDSQHSQGPRSSCFVISLPLNVAPKLTN